MVCNKWKSRVVGKGADTFGLGQWTYIALRGKGNKRLLIVSAYRVCQQTLSTIGPTTATMQQLGSLSRKFREADITSDPKTRLQFIIDLQAWLEQKGTKAMA